MDISGSSTERLKWTTDKDTNWMVYHVWNAVDPSPLRWYYNRAEYFVATGSLQSMSSVVWLVRKGGGLGMQTFTTSHS